MAVKFNIGTSAGGVGSPLPAAVARQSLLIQHAGIPEVMRPIASPFPLRTSLLVRARKTGRHDDKMRQIATKHDIHRLGACLKNPGGAAATGPTPATTKRSAAQRVFPPQDVSRGPVAVGKRASVVECGGPPPLFWRQTTVPMLTETAINNNDQIIHLTLTKS